MGILKKLSAWFDKVCPGEWNNHLMEDIFGGRPENVKDAIKKTVTWQGAYEHKDENGNWVPGPALGHGYEGGYDYSWCSQEHIDAEMEALCDYIANLGNTARAALVTSIKAGE